MFFGFQDPHLLVAPGRGPARQSRLEAQSGPISLWLQGAFVLAKAGNPAAPMPDFQVAAFGELPDKADHRTRGSQKPIAAPLETRRALSKFFAVAPVARRRALPNRPGKHAGRHPPSDGFVPMLLKGG